MLSKALLCVKEGAVGNECGGRVGSFQASKQWAELLPNTGDLESFKKQSFVLKEGVEYRIKISFRVRERLREAQ